MAEDRDGTLHPLWTDAELDLALAELHAGPEPDDHVLASIRAEVIATAAGAGTAPAVPRERSAAPRLLRRRTRRWWLAAGATVAATAAVAVATQLLPGGVGDHATALAAQTLNRAANIVANRPDPPIPAGQYQYIRVHSWNMGGADSAGGGSTVAVLQESIREVWRPSRYTEQWLERRTITGRRKVILGTRRQVRAAGLLSPVPPPIVWRARCAGYGSSRPCAGSAHRGGWDVPTPQWIATLPRDPRELYARLRRDALIDGHDDAHMLVTAADALRSGLLPADVRAALYRALTYVPHLDVTARTANLDGVSGTALGMNSQDSGSRLEIIVDPATGRFIGERETQIESVGGGLQAGTLIRSSSVSTTIVGRQGTRPDPRP